MKHPLKLNPSLPFQFFGIEDCGETCCPHCGADGRYIYTWAEFGETKSAMDGCYKQLTGRLEKGDEARFFELLAEKQAKKKTLSGFDKSVIRLLDFKSSGKYPSDWCDQKIKETLSARKSFLASKRF